MVSSQLDKNEKPRINLNSLLGSELVSQPDFSQYEMVAEGIKTSNAVRNGSLKWTETSQL
jgi:hypothetical protein